MNPAVALWKYLHRHFPDEEFDAESFQRAAAYCEQPVDPTFAYHLKIVEQMCAEDPCGILYPPWSIERQRRYDEGLR